MEFYFFQAVVTINGVDVTRMNHDQVVKMVAAVKVEDRLSLKVKKDQIKMY